ncbi:MAG: serine/threonine-protein kinase PknK [Proteobacteria bacterium]|nr:serine/threonine-protein kinase PknK [Pseudomonadota bacterium]MCP4921649.1 serine/threonine-protein kinase PknK [Pseudomonadota bacterium]
MVPRKLEPGKRIAGMTLQSRLGRGGSATVYKALDATGRSVALKVRERGEPALDRRFLREFESLRRLRLPGVVSVFEAGIDNEHIWYSMEAVDGQPIRRYLQAVDDMQTRIELACLLGSELCETLEGVHAAGFVHRDLKPSNVLVTDDNTVQLLDFGVVQWWAVGDSLTGTGGLVGTPSFMAPEQVAGMPVSGKADIFAIGLMLYEGLVGRRSRPPTPHGWLVVQALERPTPLVVRDPEIPRSLSSLIDACLSFDPADRPTASTLRRLLVGVLKDTTPADWPEPPIFVGREAELGRLEQATVGNGPRLVVVEGRTGSGRRRLVEQLRRKCVLRGIRTERARCGPDGPGAAIGAWLTSILSLPDRDAWRGKVVGEDARTLLQMWPELPLHGLSGRHDVHDAATRRDVVNAAADCFFRASEATPVLLVLEGLEDLDSITARVLNQIMPRTDGHLTVVATLDRRFANRRCERLLSRLSSGSFMRLGPLDAAAARVTAASLAPDGTAIDLDEACEPIAAVQAGLAALARVRREPFHDIDQAAAELAIMRHPLPRSVFNAWQPDAQRLIEMGFATQRRDGVHSAGPSFQRAALAVLKNRAETHDRLAGAWERAGQGSRRWLHVAWHRMRGRTAVDAWEPAVQAALAAERYGRWRTARKWLLLLDSLKHDRRTRAYRRLRYKLAWCRARVALVTDTERPRQDLVDAARARLVTEADHARQALLDAEMLLRQGMPQAALDHAVSHAARHLEACPHESCALLLAAGHAELDLGRPDRALEQALTAEDVLGAYTSVQPVLPLEIASLRATAQVESGALAAGHDGCRRGVSESRTLGLPVVEARLSQSLAAALLQLGRRNGAEAAARRAKTLFTAHGDVAGTASVDLQLAAMAIDRGEVAATRRLLDRAVSTTDKLQLRRLFPMAATIRLELASLEDDREAAERARIDYGGLRLTDPAWDVAELRNARIREDIDAVERLVASWPHHMGWRAASAQLELARARMVAGDKDGAARAVTLGHSLARRDGLSELVNYARLIAGAIAPRGAKRWDELVSSALRARWAELFLGVLEFDGRRREALGDRRGANDRYRTLHTRAVDLGHRPYVRAAQRLGHALK